MIPDDIRNEILLRLDRVEKEENVQILLAIESGSRAWGFASRNSDYDVRFIYCRTRDWYLSIDVEDRRDVIEHPIVDDIDLSGWDIRKSLRLFWKSNPAFVEWIQSPIIYRENGPFAAKVRELLPAIHSQEKAIYHYRSMAKANYKPALREEMVPAKKYFYILRPLLAVRWVEAHGTAPPIEFEKLLPLVPSADLLRDIHDLLEKKMSLDELGMTPKVERIDAFISSELERLEGAQPESDQREAEIDVLNDLFRLLVR